MGRASTSIRVYPDEHKWLTDEAKKRVKAWEKKREGPKPWVADVVAELRKGKK